MVFNTLLARYGPQYWWPGDTLFEIIAGAVLAQAVAWENARRAVSNLKKAGCLSAEAIGCLSPGALAELIKPAGYFNIKAKRLKSAAGWFQKSCCGNFDSPDEKSTEDIRRDLLGIYGIGHETADSILLYAFSRPVFVIDAYTRRIVDRLKLSPASGNHYNDYQALFMTNLEADTVVYGEFHALFVQLAKTACRKIPRCSVCPLLHMCPCQEGNRSGDC